MPVRVPGVLVGVPGVSVDVPGVPVGVPACFRSAAASSSKGILPINSLFVRVAPADGDCVRSTTCLNAACASWFAHAWGCSCAASWYLRP